MSAAVPFLMPVLTPEMSTSCSVVWSMPSPKLMPAENSEMLMFCSVVLSALMVTPLPLAPFGFDGPCAAR